MNSTTHRRNPQTSASSQRSIWSSIVGRIQNGTAEITLTIRGEPNRARIGCAIPDTLGAFISFGAELAAVRRVGRRSHVGCAIASFVIFNAEAAVVVAARTASGDDSGGSAPGIESLGAAVCRDCSGGGGDSNASAAAGCCGNSVLFGIGVDDACYGGRSYVGFGKAWRENQLQP